MPQYKLTYFDGRGRAESIRLLLAHSNIEFEDDRFDASEWAALKGTTRWGKVPILQEGDFQLSQTNAILRYLARKYGYAGDSEKEAAQMDELVGTLYDLQEISYATHKEQDQAKKAQIEEKLKSETFPFHLRKFNDIVEKNGKYLVGDKISYADFVFADNLGPNHFSRSDLHFNLDDYPALKAHRENILEAPELKEYIARRPQTLL